MLTYCEEKFAKSLFRQDDYQKELNEKIEAMRTVSKRFADFAQLCSYQEIAKTRLDFQEHQRISQNAYNSLVRMVDKSQVDSNSQYQDIKGMGSRVVNSVEATEQVAKMLLSRWMHLEEGFSRFTQRESVLSVRASRG